MITMTVMHQIENLNKSTDNRNRWERKRRKKKCAKKRTRKHKKRCALEGLDNHGGKFGRGWEIAAAAAAAIAALTIAAVMVAAMINIQSLHKL
jgi:hypothetical protein